MHISAIRWAESPSARFDEAIAAGRTIGLLAHRALVAEVTLTPKPGLVDRRNNGAHYDMTLATFMASARAVAPWFPLFFWRGIQDAGRPAPEGLAQLRRDGLACEEAMYAATSGVNTHKGSIFAFGLLCAAAGRLFGQGHDIDRNTVCAETASICQGIVAADLAARTDTTTAGERLFHRYCMTGARGEAASGFATVRDHALPAFDHARAAGAGERDALLATLLELLAVNQDTNLVSRGGLAGLAHVQRRARQLRGAGGISAPDFIDRFNDFDDDLIARHLSPGGSADLIAVTWFLAHLPTDGRLTPMKHLKAASSGG